MHSTGVVPSASVVNFWLKLSTVDETEKIIKMFQKYSLKDFLRHCFAKNTLNEIFLKYHPSKPPSKSSNLPSCSIACVCIFTSCLLGFEPIVFSPLLLANLPPSSSSSLYPLILLLLPLPLPPPATSTSSLSATSTYYQEVTTIKKRNFYIFL